MHHKFLFKFFWALSTIVAINEYSFAQMRSGNINLDSSSSYVNNYITHYEKDMVSPELTPNGPIDNQGITLSHQTLSETGTQNSAVKNALASQNRTALQQNDQPTKEQISKGSYYEDLTKARQDIQQEVYNLVNENAKSQPIQASDHSGEPPHFNLKLVDSTVKDYRINLSYYLTASDELMKMLNKEEEPNLMRAIFVTENAYYHNILNYENYTNQIYSLVGLCQGLMKWHGDSPDNKLACNYAIQALYADTIPKGFTGTSTFYPFTYDFNDFFAEKDYSNYFVTKLLNTGKGQCHSLPLLYVILAQQLNTDAYLSYSPMHSFIKFPIDSQLFDFETTCGKPNTDEWIAKSGFLSPKAVKTGIYLMPNSVRQTIAQCLAELWMEYTKEYGYGGISTNYYTYLVKNFPNCLSAKEEYVNTGIAYCANTAAKYHNPTLTDYEQYPELKQQFDFMVNMETSLDETGYVRVNPSEYFKWLSEANSEKEKQKEKQLNNIINSRLVNHEQ